MKHQSIDEVVTSFEEKFIMNHGEHGKTLILGSDLSELSDFLRQALTTQQASLIQEIREKVEKKMLYPTFGCNCGGITNVEWNNAIVDVLCIPLLQTNKDDLLTSLENKN